MTVEANKLQKLITDAGYALVTASVGDETNWKEVSRDLLVYTKQLAELVEALRHVPVHHGDIFSDMYEVYIKEDIDECLAKNTNI